MFRETVVNGLRMGGEGGKGKDDGGGGDVVVGDDDDAKGDDVVVDWGWGGGGGSASNVKMEGVACNSTKLGNKLGELNGEARVGDCGKLIERGDMGGGYCFGVPQIVFRWGVVVVVVVVVSLILMMTTTSSRLVNLNETIFV